MFKPAQKHFAATLAILSNCIPFTNVTKSILVMHADSDLLTQEPLNFAHSLFDKLVVYIRARACGYSLGLGLLVLVEMTFAPEIEVAR